MSAAEGSRRLTQTRQMRRAWAVVACACLAFAVLFSGLVAGARFYWGHATTRRTATLQVISGDGALLRTPTERQWRLVTGTTTIHEGDDISTSLGAVAWLTMFDGSTVEVTEDTVVHVARMRSSRFLKRTKHFILEPQRGALYVGMAPHGAYDYMEFTIRDDGASLTMSDENGREDAGSFLFEVLTDDTGANAPQQMRAAVLRGAATLTTPQGALRLVAAQQTLVDAHGNIGPITSAVRELVENGSFTNGLDGWASYQQGGKPTATDDGSVALLPEQTTNGAATAVELSRDGQGNDIVQTGLRQRIGKSLRVYSSLILQFDVKISDQRPLGGGNDLATFPLVVEIQYVDIQGQDREWSHGYYVYVDPNDPVPAERGTLMDPDRWQHTAFDLHSLSPLPKQITAIVVYASGSAYQTRIANISLTSSELQRAP